MDNYLKKQIITYMGNKRKLLANISNIIYKVKEELNQDTLITADAFAGSGIVSRLLKTKSNVLYTNDIAGYSKTLNSCFLFTPTKKEEQIIKHYINKANIFAYNNDNNVNIPKWIRKHWAPEGKISKSHRVYFTEKNALLIDKYMYFINTIPEKYKCFLLAQVLVQASIHNNTNGQFSAYYKDENGIGKYGGKKEIDIKRITKDILLEYPIFCKNNCKINISQMDTNNWIKTLPHVDVIYLDPPYNKHPYSIYYFMLDIINNWDTKMNIPDTYRGQPKNWIKSKYNSFSNAEKIFTDLIENINAKFIILSYNNKGIIPTNNIQKILNKKGKVYRISVEHKTYNKLKGIASYKREKKWEEVKEFIWLVDTR